MLPGPRVVGSGPADGGINWENDKRLAIGEQKKQESSSHAWF